MPSPTIELAIPSTTISPPSAGKAYTIYQITVRLPLRTSTVTKRYSQFVTLHRDLTSETGTEPPFSLPAKHWFTSTISNETLTQERRRGLEKYLRAINSDGDSRWRNSSAWQKFLSLPVTPSTASSSRVDVTTGGTGDVIVSGQQWLDTHRALKSAMQVARSALRARDGGSMGVASAHEQSAEAKKALILAGTLVRALETGLTKLSSASGGHDRLGEGEVRRRRDLVQAARKEREGLEGVLNSYSQKKKEPAPPSGASSGQQMPGGYEDGASTAASVASTATGSGSRRGGRVLGGAPAKETERTRELDNDGVLQLQKQIMAEQDTDVESLGKIVNRMKEIGLDINQELLEQEEMLGVLDEDADRVEAKINVARKRIGRIS